MHAFVRPMEAACAELLITPETASECLMHLVDDEVIFYSVLLELKDFCCAGYGCNWVMLDCLNLLVARQT